MPLRELILIIRPGLNDVFLLVPSSGRNAFVTANVPTKFTSNCFLNSDTEIEATTIDGMLSFMDTHTKVGAATCKVVMPNGKIDDASHRGFPTPWNAFCYFSGLAKLFPHSMMFNGYNFAWKNLDQIQSRPEAFLLRNAQQRFEQKGVSHKRQQAAGIACRIKKIRVRGVVLP